MPVPPMQSQHSHPLEKFILPSRRITIGVIVLFVISIVGVCIFLTRLHYANLRDVTHRNLQNLLVVQEQFNQNLLTDLDDLTLALVSDLQESEWNIDIIRNRYNAFVKDDSILQTLLILDADGTVIFDSRPEQPAVGTDVADQMYYAAHLTELVDELYIDQPVQSRVDNNWSMPISRAVVDDNGNLLNVVVVSISPLFWSELLNEFNELGEYVGIVTHDDGIVLTTFPYIESLIGTQLSDSYLSILMGSSEDKNMLPSFVDDKLTLMEMQQVQGLPVNLIIEVANTETLFQFDSVVMITTLIAVATVVSGVAVLFFYLRQHGALRLQTDNLHLANINLQQEIQSRSAIEATLSKSEERYRTINEMISDYAFSTSVNEDGTLLHDWITQSFYTMTGYVPEEFHTVFSVKNRTHPDDIDLLKQDIEQTLSGQETITEYRYKIKSGDYIWLRVKRRPIWDDDKKRVIRFIGAVSNITVEREVEQALRESEKRYRTVAELMSDFAYSASVNADGILQKDWVTDSIYTMIGYTEEEIGPFLAPVTRTHPNDRDLVKHDLELTLTGQETITEYRTQVKSGDYIWVRTKRKPIWDENKTEIVGFIGVVSNITTEKEAELALRKREEQYRHISTVLSDFAYEYYLYPDGSINTEWLIGGDENKSLHPNKITHLSQIEANTHPDDRLNVRANLKRTMENQRATTEYRIRQEDGYRWVRSIREPIWDEDEQRVVRILGTVTDITAEKEAQLALQESQQRYQEVSGLMSDYAFSVIVHEDRTLQHDWVTGPFSILMGYTSDEIDDTISPISRTHPDDEERVKRDIELTVSGQETLTEYRTQARSGEYVWLRAKRHPIWDEDKKRVIRLIGAVTNITVEKEVELALRDSEERYRVLNQLLTDYAFLIRIEDDGRLYREWMVGDFEKIMGYSIPPSGYFDSPNLQAQYKDNIEMVQPDIEQTLRGETSVAEYQIINRKDNKPHWIRAIRQPVWNKDHTKVTHYLGAVKDITFEKEAELALQTSEERYRMLTNLISDYAFSMTVVDDRLVMDWLVGSFETITGLSIDKVMSRPEADLVKGVIFETDYDRLNDDLEKTLAGYATTNEYQIVNEADHQPRWIQVSRYPIMDETTGKVIRILGATSDITAQKAAEIALRDSEERYRVLTELLTDYAFSNRVEEDGRIYTEWLVGDFESIGGYAIQPIGYITDPNAQVFYAENAEKMQPDIERTLQGETTVGEYQIINKKDNKPRWIQMTRQPIWNANHTKVIRYLGAVKDITLEKEAELISREADLLRQDLEREKGLHELRSRFVSMVTHEFRNPLAAIQSSVYILHKHYDRISDESRQEKYDRIYRQIDRLTNLLEDLLQVGELENHALHFSPQRVDILDIINDLYTEYTDSIGHEHNLRLDSDLHHAITYADIQLLRQALGNIISNAIKYSPVNSDVTCHITLEEQQIVINVIDKGMGIPENDYDRLFKAFYRASNVSTQPGTGLGLLIAQQAIELHHGAVSFTSEIGKGTQFTITIPQVIGKEDDT